MNGQQRTARIVASLVLGAPSVAAIYGSSASLVKIAGVENLSVPWVLPFCLDLLAIGIVVSAVFYGHDDRLSRFTPIAVYACSAGLQVADVWAAGPRAWAVHALPLAAAILGTEKILRLWRPVESVPLVDGVLPESTAVVGLERKEEVAGAPANTGSLPAPAPHDARPARKREPRPAVRRPHSVEADPAVVKAVRQAVAELGVPLDQVTRDDLLKHMRSRGPAPHATKVGPALRHLKEQS